jgi:phage repressor protein C with HTH and peptisase S24 domain/DNA-binding XRE family transcriptional regulator
MLHQFRTSAGLSKTQLAREAGVTIGYISKLEQERGKKPPPEVKRNVLAECLGLTDSQRYIFHLRAEMERSDPSAMKYFRELVKELQTRVEESADESAVRKSLIVSSLPNEVELHPIAIINKAAAGSPQDFTDLDYPVGVAENYIAVPDVNDPNAFGFYAYGDSMEPDFPDGSLLVASPNTMPLEGDPCFVRFSPISKETGCTFKKAYFLEDGRIRLVPINRKYPDQTYERDEFIQICPVIRMYSRIQRGGEKQSRRTKSVGRTFEKSANRASSAAG